MDRALENRKMLHHRFSSVVNIGVSGSLVCCFCITKICQTHLCQVTYILVCFIIIFFFFKAVIWKIFSIKSLIRGLERVHAVIYCVYLISGTPCGVAEHKTQISLLCSGLSIIASRSSYMKIELQFRK